MQQYRDHELYILYNLLPDIVKTSIQQMHPCSNTSIDKFDLELKEIGKAFGQKIIQPLGGILFVYNVSHGRFWKHKKRMISS